MANFEAFLVRDRGAHPDQLHPADGSLIRNPITPIPAVWQGETSFRYASVLSQRRRIQRHHRRAETIRRL